MNIDLNFECNECKCSNGNKGVSVEITRVNKGNILDHFTPNDVVNHFNISELLSQIGMKECMDYFDLKENNDE